MSRLIINNSKIVLAGSCCSRTFSNIFAVFSPAWTLDLDKLLYLAAEVCGGDQSNVSKQLQAAIRYIIFYLRHLLMPPF